jgi:hypothetical protein
MTDAEMTDELGTRRRFAGRWKVVACVGLVYLLANLLRVEAPLGRIVPAGATWLSSAWMWILPFWGASVIWAARCPACSGWINLDGRTCASCKRDLRKRDTPNEAGTP